MACEIEVALDNPNSTNTFKVIERQISIKGPKRDTINFRYVLF